MIATRSLDKKLIGIKDLIEKNKLSIKRGMQAYRLLERLQVNPDDEQLKLAFKSHESFLGSGFYMKRYGKDMDQVTDELIDKAAKDMVSQVSPMF